jgi:hypothetical protein
MTLPNFLIIGAPKGGTTTLTRVLDQHPGIFMCPVKEAGFFWAYGEPIELHGPGTGMLEHRVVNDLDRYQALFDGVTSEKAIGEVSVRYLSHVRSPELIYRFIPQAKLIVSLRQPADRAFSSFTRNLRDGLEPSSSFAEALTQEKMGLRNNWIFGRYLNKGFYYASLERYLTYFDYKQFHISLFEDLRDTPKELLSSIYKFLGVDENFEVDMSQRYNVSGIIRNPALRQIWTRSNRLRTVIRPLLSDRLRRSVFEWFIRDLEKPSFPPELRAELTEYFREDIEKLQDLIKRDLGHWLEPI